MDRLFAYEKEKMLDKLRSIEPEMCEDCFGREIGGLFGVSEHALAYIDNIYVYMKNTWNQDECTVLALMKELYPIASTGEYSYLQDLNDIPYKNDVFEHMCGRSGKKEVIYAAGLLRYYYLVREKRYHSVKIWREINEIYEKINGLDDLKKIEKKAKIEDSEEEIAEEKFMLECRRHLDKYYVGQELLKKKMCSVLAQWIYHDVRSTMLMIGPSGSGKNYMIETLGSFPALKIPIISYDCSALTPNGFNGSDISEIFKKVKDATSPHKPHDIRNLDIREYLMNRRSLSELPENNKYIVYLDEIDKIINWNHDSRGENFNALVQQQLLSALAGTETIEGVDTSQILFILGGAFPRIDDLKKEKGKNPLGFHSVKETTIDYKETIREQIIAIGGEVEFVGRIEDIIKLSKLGREELRTILMDENIGAFSKKKKIYNDSGLDLVIEEDTVEAIVNLIENEDAGARSVKNIMNQFADNAYFYDMKVGGYSCMKIHKGMLYGEAPIFLKKGGEQIENGARHV